MKAEHYVGGAFRSDGGTSPYGLPATVWPRDLCRAHRVAKPVDICGQT